MYRADAGLHTWLQKASIDLHLPIHRRVRLLRWLAACQSLEFSCQRYCPHQCTFNVNTHNQAGLFCADQYLDWYVTLLEDNKNLHR